MQEHNSALHVFDVLARHSGLHIIRTWVHIYGGGLHHILRMRYVWRIRATFIARQNGCDCDDGDETCAMWQLRHLAFDCTIELFACRLAQLDVSSVCGHWFVAGGYALARSRNGYNSYSHISANGEVQSNMEFTDVDVFHAQQLHDYPASMTTSEWCVADTSRHCTNRSQLWSHISQRLRNIFDPPKLEGDIDAENRIAAFLIQPIRILTRALHDVCGVGSLDCQQYDTIEANMRKIYQEDGQCDQLTTATIFIHSWLIGRPVGIQFIGPRVTHKEQLQLGVLFQTENDVIGAFDLTCCAVRLCASFNEFLQQRNMRLVFVWRCEEWFTWASQGECRLTLPNDLLGNWSESELDYMCRLPLDRCLKYQARGYNVLDFDGVQATPSVYKLNGFRAAHVAEHTVVVRLA